MKTLMPNEEVHPIKITICENRLEFARSEGMAGVDRQTMHRLIDDWFDQQVRNAWRLSVQVRDRQLLDKAQDPKA